MNSARKQTIFESSNTEENRKLPKYDFSINMVIIAPATHRIMNKEVHTTDCKDDTKLVEDES